MNESSPTRVIFFGTPDFAVPSLERLLKNDAFSVGLVVSQPDKPAGRGGKVKPPPVKIIAEQFGIPVLQPPSIKKDLSHILNECTAFGPYQVGVVVAFGQILPEKILSLPNAGCVNVHASLLPRWRGAAPIHRAILAGDTETGVALMQMEAGLDTGPVYRSKTVPISDADTTGSLHDTLAQVGASLLEDNLTAIARGELSATPQSPIGVTYAEKIRPEEARLNWSLSSSDLARFIRAFSPFPGAYTTIHGKRLKIFNAVRKPATKEVVVQTPGAISYLDSRSLEIQCGSGIIALTNVQLEGKRAMSVEEFLRGYRISSTDIFE